MDLASAPAWTGAVIRSILNASHALTPPAIRHPRIEYLLGVLFMSETPFYYMKIPTRAQHIASPSDSLDLRVNRYISFYRCCVTVQLSIFCMCTVFLFSQLDLLIFLPCPTIPSVYCSRPFLGCIATNRMSGINVVAGEDVSVRAYTLSQAKLRPFLADRPTVRPSSTFHLNSSNVWRCIACGSFFRKYTSFKRTFNYLLSGSWCHIKGGNCSCFLRRDAYEVQ